MDFEFNLPDVDTQPLSNAGVWLVLKRVDGAPLTVDGKLVRVLLLGQDSETYRQRSREHLRNRLERRAAGGDVTPGAQDIDLVEREGLEILAACTARWEQIQAADGTPIPCSFDAALALYRKFPVIREQVDRFIATRANFTNASLRG